MIIILYLSAALIAVSFLILVIYLSKTLKSLQVTLNHVAATLEGVEGQMKGITAETTELLNKTNRLADDIQEKIFEAEYGRGCRSGSRHIGQAV